METVRARSAIIAIHNLRPLFQTMVIKVIRRMLIKSNKGQALWKLLIYVLTWSIQMTWVVDLAHLQSTDLEKRRRRKTGAKAWINLPKKMTHMPSTTSTIISRSRKLKTMHQLLVAMKKWTVKSIRQMLCRISSTSPLIKTQLICLIHPIARETTINRFSPHPFWSLMTLAKIMQKLCRVTSFRTTIVVCYSDKDSLMLKMKSPSLIHLNFQSMTRITRVSLLCITLRN